MVETMPSKLRVKGHGLEWDEQHQRLAWQQPGHCIIDDAARGPAARKNGPDINNAGFDCLGRGNGIHAGANIGSRWISTLMAVKLCERCPPARLRFSQSVVVS
jgi:hypothetical protein